MRVEEEPFCEAAGGAGEEFEQSFTIHLQFHPMPDYPASTQLKWQELVAAVEGSFIKEITKAISKQLRCAPAQETAWELSHDPCHTYQL